VFAGDGVVDIPDLGAEAAAASASKPLVSKVSYIVDKYVRFV
jgi:hypothetical protein